MRTDSFHNAAELLRQTADRLDVLGEKLSDPPLPDIRLSEALQRLRAAYPNEMISVKVEVSQHSGDDSEPEAEWYAYSCTAGSHRGASLSAAVAAAIGGAVKSQSVLEADLALTAPLPL